MQMIAPAPLRQRPRGFTLIELLIVIVIMGLLMSLVAPTMFSKVDSTKVKTAEAQMQMIATALDTYRLDLGHPRGPLGHPLSL
jgi:general secretion pathway protein G